MEPEYQEIAARAVAFGLIDPEVVSRALRTYHRTAAAGAGSGRSFGRWMVEAGHLNEQALERLLDSLEGERPTIGGFRFLARIGSGGHGTVYKALDEANDQVVALKLLRNRPGPNTERARRFVREFTAMTHLAHPNLVKAYRSGYRDGHYFIAMEYVEGTSLRSILAARRTLPLRESLRIVRDVASALVHMDERGLIHRDVKPGNILLTRDGSVKLADLGLIRFAHRADPSVTAAGRIVGTVKYMAPEQLTGDPVDIRADLYGLGVVLHHCLSGSVPFEASTVRSVMRQHLFRPPPPLPTLDVVPPWGFDRFLARLLAKDPDDRQASPSEARAVLEHLLRAVEEADRRAPGLPADEALRAAREMSASMRFRKALTAIEDSVRCHGIDPRLEIERERIRGQRAIVVERYLDQAESLRIAGRLDEALQKIDVARFIDPEHPALGPWADLTETR